MTAAPPTETEKKPNLRPVPAPPASNKPAEAPKGKTKVKRKAPAKPAAATTSPKKETGPKKDEEKSAVGSAPKVSAPKVPTAAELEKKLTPKQAASRMAAVYGLQAEVEKRRQIHERATEAKAAAKKKLDESIEALEAEIHDQRVGPGPLFDK